MRTEHASPALELSSSGRNSLRWDGGGSTGACDERSTMNSTNITGTATNVSASATNATIANATAPAPAPAPAPSAAAAPAPPATFVNASHCPPGTDWRLSAGECAPCASGRSNPRRGAACTACAPGFWSAGSTQRGESCSAVYGTNGEPLRRSCVVGGAPSNTTLGWQSPRWGLFTAGNVSAGEPRWGASPLPNCSEASANCRCGCCWC